MYKCLEFIPFSPKISANNMKAILRDWKSLNNIHLTKWPSIKYSVSIQTFKAFLYTCFAMSVQQSNRETDTHGDWHTDVTGYMPQMFFTHVKKKNFCNKIFLLYPKVVSWHQKGWENNQQTQVDLQLLKWLFNSWLWLEWERLLTIPAVLNNVMLTLLYREKKATH